MWLCVFGSSVVIARVVVNKVRKPQMRYFLINFCVKKWCCWAKYRFEVKGNFWRWPSLADIASRLYMRSLNVLNSLCRWGIHRCTLTEMLCLWRSRSRALFSVWSLRPLISLALPIACDSRCVRSKEFLCFASSLRPWHSQSALLVSAD